MKDVLSELGLTMNQFIDFSILCGTDYCTKIGGVGSGKAIKLIKEHKNIEGVLEFLKKKNEESIRKNGKCVYQIPDAKSFNYEAARLAFKECEAFDSSNVEVSSIL